MSRKTRRNSDREKFLKPSRENGPAPVLQAAGETGGGGSPAKSRLFWFSALILIVSGYFFLTKADPWGKNLWSVAAPACLLAGYLLIIPAIYASCRGK